MTSDADRVFDVAVVGAGAAGLTLAWHLAQPGPGRLAVAVLEPPPGSISSPVRTWCAWGPAVVTGPAAQAVSASWRCVDVVDPAGRRQRLDLAPGAYRMVRSPDFERSVTADLQRLGGTTRVVARVDSIEAGLEAGAGAGGGHDGTGPYAVALGRAADGRPVRVRARWIFDSRPLVRFPPARTTWVQHFRGWSVRTRRDTFDPAHAVLMDFRTPQPDRSVSFGYVLPTSPREALVEYTEFGRTPLDDDGYDAALRHYTRQVLGLGRVEVTAVEQGAIPMVDAVLPRRTGPRTFRLGAAGGATRPSTGYTFTAAQRQAGQVAAALRAGRDPAPPAAYPERHLWMDGLLLRALDTGRLRGADYFPALFRDHPVDRVLRFLDGRTTLGEDLALMRTAPRAAMARTAVERILVRKP